VALVALCDHVARCAERGPRPSAESLSKHPACKLAGLSRQLLSELVEHAWQESRQIEL